MVEESFCVGCGHVITIATVGCRVEGNLGGFYIHLNLSCIFLPSPMYHLYLVSVAKVILFLLHYRFCLCST